jgi:nucleoside-diphosphate-sugar epimerase
MKKVLVTGASGFLGSHICEAAHEAGYEVHALIRNESSRRWLKHNWLNIHTSGLKSCTELSETLARMDIVIHGAGKTSAYNEEEFYQINTEATQMLVEESISAGVKRFVFISSQAAGGPSKGPYPKTDDDSDCPVSAYGRSKKYAEDILRSLKNKIEVIILRYPAVYGPRGEEMLAIFRVAMGSIQPLFGMKPFYTSMLYVEDAARAVIAALKARVPSGSTYYVTDGINYTLTHLYNQIDEATDHKAVRIRVPFWILNLAAWWKHEVLRKESVFTRDKVREFRARFWLASPEKAIRELGWRPQVLPQEGLAKTLRWYRYKRWM